MIGVKLKNKEAYSIDTLIITAGTFLGGKIHVGKTTYNAGRFAEPPSVGITESLISLGFESYKLKTGTPPRLLASSVSWEDLDLALGDDNVNYFSIKTDINKTAPNVPCYIAKTNNKTHEI